MTKKMKLLYAGESNWNLYYDNDLRCVFSIAKENSGAVDSIFGSVQYFGNYIKQEIKRKGEKENRITANGFHILNKKCV